MDFEVYCDESGIEALAKTDAHHYTAIGGIWLPADQRDSFKQGFNDIRKKYGIKGELKWNKISPSYFELYKEIIDFFFQSKYIRFRVILIEAKKVDHIRFNEEDAELGFYKFYYQLLNHWILDFNNYDVFLDLKVNRDKGRLKDLTRTLNCSNLTAEVRQVQGLPSDESVGIQLADILTGMVNAKFNMEITGAAKKDLISYVESQYLATTIRPTHKWEEKFNIFRINLEGGW